MLVLIGLVIIAYGVGMGIAKPDNAGKPKGVGKHLTLINSKVKVD